MVGPILLGCFLPQSAREALRLEPVLALTQPWRLFTAHAVHLTTSHAILNLTTFLGFAIALPALRKPASLVLLLVVAALSVDAGVLLRHRDLGWYVGFSGVLYGVAAGGAVLAAQARKPTGALILAGLVVKLAFDELHGTPSSTEALVGGKVLSESHLYGVLGGVAATLVWIT
ncbi:MAG: rhombosortase, partial [Myxococcota bacterium]